jgi:hypothetical protein
LNRQEIHPMSSSSHSNRFDRRHFLRSTALTAAAGIGAQMLPPALLAETTPKAPFAGLLDTFTYSDVTFEPGIHDAQLHETHNVLMGLTDDELLKPFRVRAGQPAPGADLGGWYDAYSFAPAHAFGQWLSALSRSYAINGDEATNAKITSLIRSFREMKDLGLFFKGNRYPAYVFDKVNCGLTDAYVFAHSPQAVETLDHLTTSSAPYLPGKALSRVQQAARPHKDESYTWDESYTLAENLLRVQSSQFAQLRRRSLSRPQRSRLPQGRRQRLPVHPAAELRHRRLGSERAFRRPRPRQSGQKPRQNALQL